MKQPISEGLSRTIARLRALEVMAKNTEWDSEEQFLYYQALRGVIPQLLDRLEKLEAVAEAARKVVASDYAFTMADSYGLQLIRELDNALAALEDK